MSWHHPHNHLPHQTHPIQQAQTLQMCCYCTHRPSSGPLERQVLLLQQWRFLGHRDVESRQRPALPEAWELTNFCIFLFLSSDRPLFAAPSSDLFPEAQSPLCNHGTHENPMPCTGVTTQAGNPSSLSLSLVDRAAHMVTSLMSNLCFLWYACKWP